MKRQKWTPQSINLTLLTITFIAVLINVAIYTLLERKVLGLRQIRKGPNKLTLIGLTQPFADAIKLFTKKFIPPFIVNKYIFFLRPSLAFFLALFLWRVIPGPSRVWSSQASVVVLLTLFRLNIYPLLLAGWSSNRKFSIIGALRGVAQTISYEISLTVVAITPLVAAKSLSINCWREVIFRSFVLTFVPLLTLWVISCVAETNRTPFDFSEGESELVSGFNIEYGAFGFALLFIAEYAVIILFSSLTSSFITGRPFSVLGVVTILRIIIFWLWIRATYPRHRYDLLINFAWKIILPLRLGIFSLSLVF